MQVLGDFVGAINKGWLYGSDGDNVITSFGCMPQTSSAVALWLVKLDLLIAPHLQNVEAEKTTTRNRSKGMSQSYQPPTNNHDNNNNNYDLYIFR